MKLKKTILALIVAVSVMFGTIIGASASGTAQTITALLSPDITVKLAGEVQTFADATGATVYPISYNGTTYLPIRALSNLLGLTVGWDQATKTVLLDEPAGVDLFEALDSYANVGGTQVKNSPTQISGFDVSHYAQVRTDGTWGPMANISFNLMAKYNTLTFKVYTECDCNLKVLGDNDCVLFEKDLTGAQVAQDVKVDLLHTNQLTFQVEQHESIGNTFFFNARLDA